MAVRDFNTLVDALPDAVVVIDDGGLVHHANAAAERLFGWSLADRVGTSALDLVHPDDLEVALLSLTSIVSKDVGTPIELRVKTATDWIIVELIGAPYSGDDVEGGIVLTLRDLTERRRWEVAGGDDSQFRALLQNGAALTALIGPDGVVRSVSAAVARQLGRDAETVIGSNLADLVHPEDHDALRGAFLQARAVREATADDRRVSCEVLMAHRLGHLIPFQLSIVDLVDDPAVEGFVVSGHDVTELHATRVELAHTAAHDSLTGLPNRAAVRAHLREVLEVDTEGRRLAVGFVDLDRFKPVNDLFGHEAGDELLVAVAGRLKNALRTGDLVGRFGGDEFVIVAAASTLGEALRMAERLEDTIAEPFDLTCGTVQVYASIGVALADESSTVESLLTEADAAMYSVKHGRRGTPQNTRRSVNERRALAEALPAAFERDEFVVHYQPIIDLQASDTVGYEALVRWQHPERGLLLPGQFLDVVEELGHEHEIGDFVLRRALDDMHAIDATFGDERHMNVNAAAAQLVDPGFPDKVRAALQRADVDPRRLTIEVSERTILERSTQGPSTPVMTSLQALKNDGVSIAADDFGTGYSSLTHLISYPIDYLKIDRSFVAGVLIDEHRRTIVSALIGLAKGMGLVVVAEGVEERSQSRILREFGCDVAQGFLYGRPMPIEDIVRHTVPAI